MGPEGVVEREIEAVEVTATPEPLPLRVDERYHRRGALKEVKGYLADAINLIW